MRLLLLFHLILFSSFFFSKEASGLSLEGVFETLEQFVPLEQGGLRLKDGIMEANQRVREAEGAAKAAREAGASLGGIIPP